MPQNSSARPVLLGHAEVREEQDEDEQVVERERALDEVDGRVGDRVVLAGQHEHHDRGEQRDDEPADAPDHALAEARLAPAREEVQVDPEEDDRRDGQDDPRERARHERERHGHQTKKKVRPSTAYTASSWSPSNHVDSPSCVTCSAISTASTTRAELEAVEDQRHREVADEQRQQDEHRRGEQRDLRGRADRDVDREVHLVARGEVDRDPVLGRVADDRDDDHADEERRQADRLRRLGDRADEDLRHHADRDAGAGQHEHGLAHRPRLADVVLLLVLGVEEVLVRPEREDQARDVGEQQHDRDADRELLDVGVVVDGLGVGARQARALHELEQRRHDQRDDRQQQHQGRHVRGGAVEASGARAGGRR